jgi:GINS complex subunit 1
MNKVKELRWHTGAVIPEVTLQQEILSVAERDYFAAYNKLLNDYNDSIDFDLTTCIEPPKDFKIMIRVLKDYGEILVENGMLKLIKGGTHYLRRTDVEELIRQGVVEHISSNMF